MANQMKLKRSQLWLLIPVLLLTQAFACQNTAQKILNKLASTNLAFERSVTIAHTDKALTDDQERQFLTWSKSIAQEGNSASTAFLAGNNAGALTDINLGIGVIDDAINNGLAGIKNPTTKTELNAGLLAIRGLFTTAKGFIPGGTP